MDYYIPKFPDPINLINIFSDPFHKFAPNPAHALACPSSISTRLGTRRVSGPPACLSPRPLPAVSLAPLRAAPPWGSLLWDVYPLGQRGRGVRCLCGGSHSKKYCPKAKQLGNRNHTPVIFSNRVRRGIILLPEAKPPDRSWFNQYRLFKKQTKKILNSTNLKKERER